MNSIEQALAEAKAACAKLEAELGALQTFEQKSLDGAKDQHAKLAAVREARLIEVDDLTEQVRVLELGREQALSLRKKVRLARNVLLRGALGTSAFLGWLMAATSGWHPLLVLVLAGAEAGAVWWLSDYADHLGMRDE